MVGSLVTLLSAEGRVCSLLCMTVGFGQVGAETGFRKRGEVQVNGNYSNAQNFFLPPL